MFPLCLGLREFGQIRRRGEHEHAAIDAGEMVFHVVRPGAQFADDFGESVGPRCLCGEHLCLKGEFEPLVFRAIFIASDSIGAAYQGTANGRNK